MAYGEFYVEHQCWARFPKVLIMCRKHGRMENGNCAVERKRYVPERTCCIVGGYYDEVINECYTQLSCGHETREYEPNYCSHCGARVVSE